MPQSSGKPALVVGEISGLYGVRGWVKIFSHTRPKDNILSYSPWQLRRPDTDTLHEWPLAEGRVHGKGLVARLEGMADRNAAEPWIGAEIIIARGQLPVLPAGEYYWRDLIGLHVFTVEGECLGQVTHLLETGVQDVLAIAGAHGEILIPFVLERIVLEIDLAAGQLRVDWDASE